ncbi:cyclic nucleotide-binding domain-containing protein [Sulfitobacter sp. JBTF-M27]|uniref:Cyclic nucleotide-binding domain-containing protein n=1 Tax=Sulfitobacter sediminilitoris TaxID=2698830 RepID=A0A6P0CGM8_9RHOB|nr:Crp/Fnr family transcriptional regulator [Sulfitobacter sediminilitoris]NEK23623.1 cyclic nucleotide-binding domain-containing protein [Sulfitobacter sediminilitoris]
MLTQPTWRAHFPGLGGISDDVSRLLDRKARTVKLDKGSIIFGPGNPAENLLLLVKGTVRVQQLSEAGREIVLYRVHAGESCVLTTACLLAFEDYSAEGIAETDVEAILIPRDDFDELMSISKEFRAFVFEAYSKRITDLFLVIEEIAFKRMDIRVAQKLLELSGEDSTLHLTHQQLAVELGTAREVISRQLKEFERRNWLTLSRGVIELRNPVAIKRLADTA